MSDDGAPITPIRATDDVADAPRRQRAERLRSLAVAVTDDWLTVALPPREHLLTDTRTDLGAVDKAGTWLFAGAGGAGKGYATVDLSLAVATGGSWYCLATSGRSGRVLMLVAEDVADDVRRRLKLVADRRYPGANAEGRITVLPLRGQMFLFLQREQYTGCYAPGEGLLDLLAYIGAERETNGAPIDLVIVDPISRVAGISLDKDSAAATAFVDACDRLSDAAGGLVLAVAHTNKLSRSADKGVAESADVRGSSGLIDGPRGVIQLLSEIERSTKQPTGRAILSVTKTNHVARWADIILRRGVGGVLEPLDEVDRAIFESERKKPAADEKRAARDAKMRDQIAADAIIVHKIITKGYKGRLRDAVRSQIGCGVSRADLAIARDKENTGGVSVSPSVSAGAPRDTETLTVSPAQHASSVPPCPPYNPPVPRHRDTGVGASGTVGVSKTPPETPETPETPEREPGEDDL